MKIEIESGTLAINVYRGKTLLLSAQACTNGGWAMYLGLSERAFKGLDERSEVMAYIYSHYPKAEAIE